MLNDVVVKLWVLELNLRGEINGDDGDHGVVDLHD